MKNLFYLRIFCTATFGILFFVSSQAFSEDSSFIMPQYSKRVSLDLKDADMKDVLKVFSRQIGANFVLDSKIEKTKVTVYLDNVPVEEAMERILASNGLTYVYNAESNIFTVSAKDQEVKMVTRVYPLKNATVSGSKLNATISIVGAGAAVAGGKDSGISSSLQSAISKDGKVAEDPRTNSLIITDYEENFSKIDAILAKLDIAIPQVLIEVKMLDVSKINVDTLGFDYGSGTFFSVTGATIPTFFPFNQKNILDKGGLRTFSGAGTMGMKGMTAAATFLEKCTDTRALARPRILTMDNQTAQIMISNDEVVGTITVEDATTGKRTTTAERAKTGVFLTVTPQVNLLTNEITLAITPKAIEASQSQFSKEGGQAFRDTEERSASVIMKVQAGETIMIGGLLRKKLEKVVTKVPFLGSIPFLGRLFRSDNINGTDRELIIFITPTILNNLGDSLDGKKKAIDFRSRETSSPDRSKVISEDLLSIANQHQRK